MPETASQEIARLKEERNNILILESKHKIQENIATQNAADATFLVAERARRSAIEARITALGGTF